MYRLGIKYLSERERERERMSWNRHEFFDLKRFVVDDDGDTNLSTKEHGKIWNKLPASQITCAMTRVRKTYLFVYRNIYIEEDLRIHKTT
jgi:hypothetical protein